MGRTYIIQHHPLPLRYWLHEHHWLVSSSLGLIIAILAIAIAAPTASMVRAAIAEHTGPAARATEVIAATALPREWIWSLEPISFDHMYRQSAPHAVVDYTRDLTGTYYSPRRSGR
jgi:hypothetical protein